jgi:hypothetical protein
MKIILYPIGGLANRMRAIDSAFNLAGSKKNITVWWIKDKGLNCEFGKLFNSVPSIHDKNKLPLIFNKLLSFYDKNHIAVLFLLKVLERLHILLLLDENTCLEKEKTNSANSYLFCFIRTWEAFYPQEKFHSELFKLNDKNKLEKELSKINNNTIGVHIRRTDNVWSIKNSPLELFEQKMKKELENNQYANFYLCSDDDNVKHFFQSDFWKNIVKMPDGVVSRNSEDGIIQAACEMYTLSKTNKIIGSYWSSFGEIAARLGNIEIEICSTTP